MARRWIQSLAGLAVVAGLSACSSTPSSAPCSVTKLPNLLGITDISGLLGKAAAELCEPICPPTSGSSTPLCDERQLTRTVLVPDFLNLQTYVPGTPGLYMGEQMRAALNQQCRAQIVQVDFGKYFKLNDEGLAVLTRRPDEIQRDEFRSQDVVVGTYSFQGNKLSVFIRTINGPSGIIKKMVTREVSYACAGDTLAVQNTK